MKLQLPPADAGYEPPFAIEEIKAELPRKRWPRVRTYSVRDWDADSGRLTIDFVNHGSSGVAGPWAAAAQPGDRVQLIGPGGAYSPDPDADWHLLAGDACVLPAIAASLTRIGAGVPVVVVAAVDGPEEEQKLVTAGDLELRWVHRDAAAELDPDPLVEAVRELRFRPGGSRLRPRRSRCSPAAPPAPDRRPRVRSPISRSPATGSGAGPRRDGARTSRSGSGSSSRISPARRPEALQPPSGEGGIRAPR